MIRFYTVVINLNAPSYIDIEAADSIIAGKLRLAINESFIPPAGIAFDRLSGGDLKVTPVPKQQ